MSPHHDPQDPDWKRFDATYSVMSFDGARDSAAGGTAGVGHLVCIECQDRHVIIACVTDVGMEVSVNLTPDVAAVFAAEIMERVGKLTGAPN